MPLMKRQVESKANKELLKQAKDDVESWYSYWEENNLKYRDCNSFVNSDDGQWSQGVIRDYKERRKVRVTFNMVYSYKQMLEGQFRENSPAMQVRPIGNVENANQQKIDFTEQLLRTQLDSNEAKRAWQDSYGNALTGYGAIELFTEFEDTESFNQRIRLMNIKNPVNSGFDPAALGVAKQDGRYSFLVRRMGKREFKKKHPNIPFPESFEITRGSDARFDWGNEEEIAIVKYAYKRFFTTKLHEMSDGSFVRDDELEEVLGINDKERREVVQQNKENDSINQSMLFGSPQNQTPSLPIPEKLEVVDTRTIHDFEILICELIKDQIIEKTTWPAKILPILYVDGGSYIETDTGKEIIKPFVEVAMDPQRAINYSVSENLNAIKRAQYAKILHTVEQSKGFEKYYRDNSSSTSLPYNPDTAAPPPSIIPPAPVSPVYEQAFQTYSATLQFVLGMHNAVIGAPGLERSGVALGHEIRQGNKANFGVIDNVYRTMEVVGRLMLELFPHILDSTRAVTLTRADGSIKSAMVNEPDGFNDAGEQQFKNQIDDTKFMLKIEPGAPFGLQKKEALEALAPLVQMPQTQNLVLDTYAANLDLPSAPQLAQRFKNLLPTSVRVAEGDMTEQEAQQQQQQAAQSPQAQLAQGELRAKQTEAQADIISAQAKMVESRSKVVSIGATQQANQTKAQAEIQKAQLSFNQEAIKAGGAQKDQVIEQMGQAIQQLQQEREQLINAVRQQVGGT